VNSSRYRARGQVEKRRAAGSLRLRLRRLWLRLSTPLVRGLRSRRSYQRGRYAVQRRAWRGNRPLVRTTRLALLVGAVVFLLWVTRAVAVVISGNSELPPFDVDSACRNMSVSCGALAATFGLFLPLGLASMVFLFRLQSVHRPFVRKARERPHEVVQTAGNAIGEIVGRDELCYTIIEGLRDPSTRRPHVVTGSVATGKTALLVRLTKLLAERGAVPIPVRLQDAQSMLRFRELARWRFLAEAEAVLQSDDEGEKIWRQLLKNDQIVVLADGLEEALIEGDAEQDRDNLIRLAIYQANEQRLPLIIASRPLDALRGVEAAVVDLEPLSQEAARQVLHSDEYERRLDWIVETADVAETPLYLQIAYQLDHARLLEYVSPIREGERLDLRSIDRAELRLRLLDTWMEGLIRGHFPPGLALSRRDRQATVEQLSALACIGLREDRLVVRFEELEGTGAQGNPAATRGVVGAVEPPLAIIEAVRAQLQKLGYGLDIKLAAIWGTRLGLVEARGDGVCFLDSIMQAYLGSRLIHLAMTDAQYRDRALWDPGRELLIALVMHSRAKVREARQNGVAGVRIAIGEPHDTALQKMLAEAASAHYDVKALDLYAAALEIDSVDEAPTHAYLAKQLREHWPRISARDERRLEEAKLNLVSRFGEAARTIAEQLRRNEPGLAAAPGYLELYRIGISEPSYPVRLAVAQEIGAGGDEALAALEDVLGPPTEPARLEEGWEHEEREWREKVTRAWLAPMLVGSATSGRSQEAALSNLERWVRFVGTTDRRTGEPDLRLSLEAALAQGFKHAANRRRWHPHLNPRSMPYLQEQARTMLRGTSFWYSRLTLLHALCLSSLPDETDRRRITRGWDVDPRVVEYWTAVPDARSEHPFVAEARKLTMWALETGQPERFLWIDESGVLGRIGSRPAHSRSRRTHNLWIAPSTGWTALHPRAQQLVADVLLLLNMADRDARPSDRDRRLQRTNRNDLPPCLAGERDSLDPIRTVGMTATSESGSNCKIGCPFELCPYPPKGEQSYRKELSEAFSRRQQALLKSGLIRRRVAPWQEAPPRDLRRFWREMRQRAQPS
jgi:hypothetical protein